MKQIINIAVVGLGKVGKKNNIVAISAKNINKKRKFKINKKIFY